jgi:hypothetical protein
MVCRSVGALLFFGVGWAVGEVLPSRRMSRRIRTEDMAVIVRWFMWDVGECLGLLK